MPCSHVPDVPRHHGRAMPKGGADVGPAFGDGQGARVGLGWRRPTLDSPGSRRWTAVSMAGGQLGDEHFICRKETAQRVSSKVGPPSSGCHDTRTDTLWDGQ